MHGTIDHIMINVNEYERSAEFYSWLMPMIGYEIRMADSTRRTAGFTGKGSNVWIREAVTEFKGDRFDKRRVGLAEMAFAAESKEQVDSVFDGLEAHGGKSEAPPHPTTYDPNNYVVFFFDPDGIKLELLYRHSIK